MGSYKWGYKSPNIGCNSNYPTYNPTYNLGFGVPYFNTFCLKGTIMKYKFILFFSLVT